LTCFGIIYHANRTAGIKHQNRWLRHKVVLLKKNQSYINKNKWAQKK
jgi:hypothetical protein